jgi:hypothetical protein
MRRLLAALTVALIPSLALAQSAVRQSGAVSPNDATKWDQTGIIKDAGGVNGDNTGHGVNPFAISDGGALGLCFHNGQPLSGTDHPICIGHDGSGNTLITINGTPYPFPGAGNGNVSGPTSPFPTTGDFVKWNGSTAVADSACGFLPSPVVFTCNGPGTGVPRTVSGYNYLLRGNATSLPSDFVINNNFDNLVSIVTATAGTTSNILNTTAMAAYIDNNNATYNAGAAQNAVAYFGIARSKVSNAYSWGINTIVTDSNGITGAVINNEFDLNVYSASTSAYGLVLVGASTQTPAESAGFVVGTLSNQSPGTIKWGQSIWSQDGASDIGILLGATSLPGTSVPGQQIRLNYYDSSGGIQAISLRALSTGPLEVVNAIPGLQAGVAVYNNTSIVNNTGASFSGATSSGVASFSQIENGSGVATLVIAESSTGGIQFQPGSGAVSMAGVPGVTCSGTPTSSFATAKGLVTHC